MILLPVTPVISTRVRGLCVTPYRGHPKGCPNYGACDRCPPRAPLFPEVFDTTRTVYALVNEFNLGAHVERMREKHPTWGYPQLSCVLYWQNTARKQLRGSIESILPALRGYAATWCPEGMGVDVTATLANVGLHLEWPAVTIARQVAFLAYQKEGK